MRSSQFTEARTLGGFPVKTLNIQDASNVNEISNKVKDSYRDRAQAQVDELEPYKNKGEYKDIAQRMIARRSQGLKRVDKQK